jgi:hypothetical protein
MGYTVLQLLSKYVRFGRRILLFFLMDVEEAKIKLQRQMTWFIFLGKLSGPDIPQYSIVGDQLMG